MLFVVNAFRHVLRWSIAIRKQPHPPRRLGSDRPKGRLLLSPSVKLLLAKHDRNHEQLNRREDQEENSHAQPTVIFIAWKIWLLQIPNAVSADQQ